MRGRWVRLLLGVAAIGAGVALTLRPFTSLGVLVLVVAATFFASGIGEIASVRTAARRWLAIAAGLAWIGGAVVVLAWAGITIHALAIVAGVSMLLGGLARLAGAIRAGAGERAIDALSGASRVIFGVLALSWPDITVLVLALLVGPSAVIFGSGQVLAAWPRGGGPVSALSRRRPRWLRPAGVAASVVLALGLVAVSAAIHGSSASTTPFYTAPARVPARPGVLLRSQLYTDGVPSGYHVWRILYTTTRDEGEPAVASGIVIAAADPPPGPRPVIAWAHGTTGVATNCAPSLLSSRWTRDVIPGLDRVIRRGWVIVASDYVGLGTAGPHPYLIGQGEARSVLDSVRAARHLLQLKLSRETVVWGHSQEAMPLYGPE